MRYRRFGSTDIVLSEITFGSMRFVSGNLGPKDDALGKQALEAALAAGVTAIHSSYEYGTRWAVGEVLRGHPKRLDIQHIIKAPVPDFDDDAFDEAKFRRLVEDALLETGAERIAIVQHLQRGVGRDVINDRRGDPARLAAMPAINEELAATAAALKAEGKIGALACFPYTPGFAAPAIASGIFDGLVAYFSLVETELVPLLDTMRQRGMGFVTMRSLLQGLLTNKRADRSALAADDPLRKPNWDAPYARFERLQRELGHEATCWSDLAVKFALADPLFPSVILSMNTPAQVEGILAAADGNYPDPSLLQRIHALNSI
jgi:aryl-alcohol dehydrogenase-like predicted oxidoreductase